MEMGRERVIEIGDRNRTGNREWKIVIVNMNESGNR